MTDLKNDVMSVIDVIIILLKSDHSHLLQRLFTTINNPADYKATHRSDIINRLENTRKHFCRKTQQKQQSSSESIKRLVGFRTVSDAENHSRCTRQEMVLHQMKNENFKHTCFNFNFTFCHVIRFAPLLRFLENVCIFSKQSQKTLRRTPFYKCGFFSLFQS